MLQYLTSYKDVSGLGINGSLECVTDLTCWNPGTTVNTAADGYTPWRALSNVSLEISGSA